MSWDDTYSPVIAGIVDRATKGDKDAVDDLLSQPAISEEAEPYWLAYQRLLRERPLLGGMATIPLPIPREPIEREGRRLGFDGPDLEEFVGVINDVCDHGIELDMKRAAASSKKRTQESRRPDNP